MQNDGLLIRSVCNSSFAWNKYDAKGQFYEHDLTFIPVGISDYIHHKVWDEITHLFPNVSACSRGSVGMNE